ncbi:MAG TPA: hypothetical protein VG722_03905 [Tepidisphaeraceae bacterium]|nr:hypothetical protein [Tepidisphaeraceae bacterium]
MDWLDVYWDADIEKHLAQHGVSREDFEKVIRDPIGEDSSDSSGRPIRFGFAEDGRKIAAVYEMVDEVTVLPITAYEVK